MPVVIDEVQVEAIEAQAARDAAPPAPPRPPRSKLDPVELDVILRRRAERAERLWAD